MKNTSVQNIEHVIQILQKTYTTHPMHEAFKHDAFHMLIAVVLSQRATDAMTIPVSIQLFKRASTAQLLANTSLAKIEKIIRPIGFFHAKAQAIQKLARVLVERHKGKVPSTEQELLALPQVGRKTSNIMLTLFFNTPQIAVDVHVHRITQRLGWITSTSPEETEAKLTALIPHNLIHDVNRIFVRHGQEICKPISPKCSVCPIEKLCYKIGVHHQR